MSEYECHEVPLSEALALWSDEWDGFVFSNNLNISHLPQWVSCAAISHEHTDDIKVLICFDSHVRPVSFIPFLQTRRTLSGIPYRALEIGATLPAYHTNWLAGPGGAQQLVALKKISLECDVHAIVINGVPDTSPTAYLLREPGIFPNVLLTAGESSPIVALNSDWESFMAAKNSKFRYRIRSKHKKLDAAGDWRIDWYTLEDQIDIFLSIMTEVESNSWKADRGIAVMPGSTEEAYYRRLLPMLARMQAMMACTLVVEDEVVAYALRYVWKSVVGGMKSTYKTTASTLSPGTILQYHVMKKAHSIGAKVFDFLGDRSQHKDEWATDHINHSGYICYTGCLRGRLAVMSNAMRCRLHSYNYRLPHRA